MATYEWHWHVLYHAADEPNFPVSSFQQDAEQLADIHLIPSAHLTHLSSKYALPQIWLEHMQEGQGIAHAKASIANNILLFRQGIEVAAMLLSTEDDYFIRYCPEKSLGEIAHHWPEQTTFEKTFDEVLVAAIQNGWMIGYTLNR